MEQVTKASIRTLARKALAALSPGMRAAAAAEICRRIEGLPEWRAARSVALYSAQASEPDLARLSGPDKTFCFPRVSGNSMEFHRCDSIGLLRPGPWNLVEPDPEQCPVVPATEIDLLLIPGLAFTRAGGRLGRGGGFYDRYLSGIHPRAVKIGVCFKRQIFLFMPLDVHDIEMDLVITESEENRFGE